MKKIIASLITLVMILSIFCTYSAVYAADDITWTDFSNASFRVRNNEGSENYRLLIDNVTIPDNQRYVVYQITNSTQEPAMTESVGDSDNTGWEICPKDDSEGKLAIDIQDYLEKKEDYYLWIGEQKFANSKWNYHISLAAKKLDKINVPASPEAFSFVDLTNDNTAIILKAPKGHSTVRKMNVKIGKITDTSLLQSIKNDDSNGFANLLTYSKNANSIYSGTLNTNNSYGIGYQGGSAGVIDLRSVIDNNAYYYLYVNVDEEDNTYYPVEAVTIAKASKYTNSWYFTFYGDSDFNMDVIDGGNEQDLSNLDPQNYINLPLLISYDKNENKTNSKISISDKVKNYSLYYQYCVMDAETSAKFIAKYEEYKKDKDINKLNELRRFIPTFNDSAWIKTTDGSIGDLKFLNNYSENDTVAFVLWAKLETGEYTYYDFQTYTMNGSKISSASIDDNTSSNTTGKSTNGTSSTTKGYNSGDSTTATKSLPKAGSKTLIASIITVLGIMAIVSYFKYRKSEI